ncbi:MULTISPECIES: efflux RND transporter permease subunit [unclassified Imperialibacter]|uniref:efflux RND transporter permease subunit n=1 Tax=unclassified Imperialibacter TaxID=2629706 RepID=UPI00125BD938|nr:MULTISPECIES: efflux RND transporter permease subunit [unclassified Imperialibacter]CAD5258953.1 Multidrug transporter AcrB [Imperialibacter sp. 89]CAD5265890.1 Multidrug transporter AcrB [Imperialibacter sp. 75]VVT21293.1 Multidrug transporter AcrB [Imperialibacter sp. EC-SDR9]
MKIAEFSVKNYQFTLIVFAMVVGLGLNSLFNMPRGEDPEFESPSFAVVVVYPGTSPVDMEELVVDPIEKKISELEDVKKIVSNVDDGLVVMRIDYKYEIDPDDAYQEVIREMNTVQQELPADIFSIEIRRFTPTDVNILQIALVSETATYRQLETQADELKERLEEVKALKKVEDWGFPETAVKISLNLEKMAAAHIPLNAVLGAIQSENVNMPGGSVNAGTRRFNIKTSGSYTSLEEVQNTIVYSAADKVVYLKDIADVAFDYEEENHLTRLNGKRAVLVTAAQKEGQNIFKVQEVYQPVVDKFKAELPSNMELVQNFDQATSVDRRLSRFVKDFIIAILLVSITLLPLGYRAAIVVMVSIPLSLAIGLFMLDTLGYTINQLSIVGLIVALGILVDDSIVVVENIERYLREGYGKKEAAIEATKQIGLAVVGCTATLIFAFLPLLFLPEAAGDFIRNLPMAVVTTVIASLFVSLTIVPFLSSRILKTHTSSEGNIFFRALKRLISGSYSKLLDKALMRPWATLGIAFLIFLGALALVPSVGFSLFPASEKPQFLVNIETPVGTSLQETDNVARYVEKALAEEPTITYYTTNVGKGNPMIYYNVVPKAEASNFAQFYVQLESDIRPEEKIKTIDELRERFLYYPNAKIEVKDFEQGPPIEAPIAIRVFGENLDTLRSLTLQVEKILKDTPGTIYVNNPLATLKTDLRFRINKDKAGMLGVPLAEVDKAIRMAVAGLTVGDFTDANGKEYNLLVTVPKGSITDMSVFDRVYVNSYKGASVPLSQLASLEFETSTNLVKHYDKERFATVTAFVESNYLVEAVTQEVVADMDQFDFPQGYSYKAAGEQESKEESFGGLGTIILITAFGFMGILVLEFGTFKSSLIVLSVIPLGIIGAILMLLITGYTFSFTATVGLIALVGIEVKNSILLVDFTNQLRREGMELNKAIREAGEVRFVPIVLTSLTAIGGLTPLALEGNPLYSPLAIVLIGGLISSTILSRIVTPVLYKLLPPSIVVEKKQAPEEGLGMVPVPA